MTYTEDQYNKALQDTAAERQKLRNDKDADIAAVTEAKDAEIAALQAASASLTEELNTIKARTAQAVTAAAQLLNEQDPDKLRAGMASIVQFAQAPEIQRQIAEAEAKLAADAAEVERLKALAAG